MMYLVREILINSLNKMRCKADGAQETRHTKLKGEFLSTTQRGKSLAQAINQRSLRHQKTNNMQGFTLLELLVVMVIIGLLAAYVGPKYFSQVGKSEIKMAQAQIDALEKALHQYRLDVGSYPATEQGLAALVTRPSNEARWQGPYLSKLPPADPWGRPYVYKYPGDRAEFDLLSYGKDGQPGGEGEAADITNW